MHGLWDAPGRDNTSVRRVREARSSSGRSSEEASSARQDVSEVRCRAASAGSSLLQGLPPVLRATCSCESQRRLAQEPTPKGRGTSSRQHEACPEACRHRQSTSGKDLDRERDAQHTASSGCAPTAPSEAVEPADQGSRSARRHRADDPLPSRLGSRAQGRKGPRTRSHPHGEGTRRASRRPGLPFRWPRSGAHPCRLCASAGTGIRRRVCAAPGSHDHR